MEGKFTVHTAETAQPAQRPPDARCGSGGGVAGGAQLGVQFGRLRAAGMVFPMLLPAKGESVEGLVVDGINRTEGMRLRYFEGDDYRLARRLTILATFVSQSAGGF